MSVLEYAMPARKASPQDSKFLWLKWGPFLGISWTWCIGMFLPVLLIRDFGPASYWIFAIPNVVGAAAMGWTIRSPEVSRRLTAFHAPAAIAFSMVTIAFHFFFVSWLVRLLWSPSAIIVLLGLSIALIATVHFFRWSDRVLSPLAFIVSYILLGDFHIQLSEAVIKPEVAPFIGLSLVCLFGFALCPYLDLTFHRARQQLYGRSDAIITFGFGFGLVFFVMILLTPRYARPMWHLLNDGYLLNEPILARSLTAYLLMQSAITVAYHAREIFGETSTHEMHEATPFNRSNFTRLTLLIAGIGTAILAGAIVPGKLSMRGLTVGEIGYRCFMGFYGLIFPAYVWLCMLPGRGKLKPTRRQMVITCIAILVALPMFWLGFIERKTEWLVPGVGVVLISKLFDRRAPRDVVGVTVS